jgi:hypothetical protein
VNEVLVTFASPITDTSQAGTNNDLKVSYWPDQEGLPGHAEVQKVVDLLDCDALARMVADARRVHGERTLIIVNAEPCRPWQYVAPILATACSAGVHEARIEAGQRKARIRLPDVSCVVSDEKFGGSRWFLTIKVPAADQAGKFRMRESSGFPGAPDGEQPDALLDAKGLAAALARRKAARGDSEVDVIVEAAVSASWKDVVEAAALATEAGFGTVGFSATAD